MYLFFCLSISVYTGDVLVDLVKEVDVEKGRMVYKTPVKGDYANIVIPFSSAPFVLSQLWHGPPKTRCIVYIYSCLMASRFPY